VTALSNSSGTIQTAYGYNAWGERTVGSDWSGAGSQLNNLNAIGYSRQFFDNETGLQPLGNGERYYSASLGRFTQQDSFSGMLDQAMSLNCYGYANGNPLRFIDPSGHDGEESQAWKDAKAFGRGAWNSVKELGCIAHDLAVQGMPLGGIGVAVGAVELKSAPPRQYRASIAASCLVS
jgi:RHS repeat-associated protein